jgi:hypothetical protein
VARVKSQDDFDSALGMKALLWVSTAFRYLEIDELLHVLAVRIGDTDHDPAGMVTENTLMSVCAGLLTVEPYSRHVRPIRKCFR